MPIFLKKCMHQDFSKPKLNIIFLGEIVLTIYCHSDCPLSWRFENYKLGGEYKTCASAPGLGWRPEINSLKGDAQSHSPWKVKRKTQSSFQGWPWLPSCDNADCSLLLFPVLLSISSLWGFDLSLVWEIRSWEIGTKRVLGMNPGNRLPLPTPFLALHMCTVWVHITGELRVCSFREHNMGNTFLIYIE